MTDTSWIFDKYADVPTPSSINDTEIIMRQDVMYLKGLIDGMMMFMEKTNDR